MRNQSDESVHERETSQPAFWNERYAEYEELFGTKPNAWVAEQAPDLAPGATVLDVAAGEGRNALYLAQRGHPVTAVDFAEKGLRKLERQAEKQELDISCEPVDVLSWQPERQWDVIVVTFLQLLPEERPALFERLLRWLSPGGTFLGIFFRPDHLAEVYADVGPPVGDRMIPTEELRGYFPSTGSLICRPEDRTLQEGKITGRCAVSVIRYDAHST